MTKRTNTETRKATLELAGKGNFLSLELPEGLAPGSKIHLVIDENGQLVLGDGMETKIMEDGYVKNTRLHRRWVMAQMFHALDYRHWNYYNLPHWEKSKHEGYNAYVNQRLSFDYQYTMMSDEVKVLSKLETRDEKCFKERESFFNKEVVIKTCRHYMDELRKYVNALPTPRCKGVPYKRIKGKGDIYVCELEKKLYNPLAAIIVKMNRARNYAELHKLLLEFNRVKVKLDWDTRKSPDWKDAYKGNGAYYTLKNLVMYHNCYIFPEYGTPVTGFKAVQYLESHLKEYKGNGWRYFALLKKVIADNNFDYNKRMKDLGVRK